MPTYRGATIFGEAVTMTTSANPNAEQVNAFFGISGVESLDGGSRGRTTLVKGVLRFENTADLGAALRAWQSYQLDGKAGTLVDQYGYSWPYVKVKRFVPSPRVLADPTRGYSVSYMAEFSHMV